MPSASSTALIAVHYQNEVLHPDGKIRVGIAHQTADERARLITAARRLLDCARAAGASVISVRAAYRPDYKDVVQNGAIFRNLVKLGAFQDGSWGCQFYDGLAPLPEEFVVTHQRVNPFYGSPLEGLLHNLGIERVIVAGLATHSAVEHTVRHAADIGYDVLVAADACSAAERDAHEASLRNMSLIAAISDSTAIAALLNEG
jgi:nicotinamidase-related amidase